MWKTFFIFGCFLCANAAQFEEPVCNQSNNGRYFRNPKGCQWFFYCDSENGLMEDSCRDNTFYNPELNICDDPKNVNCNFMLQSKPNPPGSLRCDDSTAGQFFPHPQSCQKFLYCDGQNGLLNGDCGNGMYYDWELVMCKPKDIVRNCLLGTPAVPTTRSPLPSATQPPPMKAICPSTTAGIVSVRSYESCEEYYVCFNGNPYLARCSPGLHFNALRGFCDQPVNAGCNIQNSMSRLPDCEFGLIQLKPHPTNCNWFVFCYNGNRFIQQCPHLQQFDINEFQCVSHNRAVCVNQ